MANRLGKIWVEAERGAQPGVVVLTLKDISLRRRVAEAYGNHNATVSTARLARIGFPQHLLQDLEKGRPVRFRMNYDGYLSLLEGGRGNALSGLEGRSGRLDFEVFFDAYIEAALWTTNDEDETHDEPLLTNHNMDSFDKASLEKLRREARRFFHNNLFMIAEKGASQGGHDFWLTRNGHGAGFWDGDWPIYGDDLTKASERYGEVDLYVGDDGRIHV